MYAKELDTEETGLQTRGERLKSFAKPTSASFMITGKALRKKLVAERLVVFLMYFR